MKILLFFRFAKLTLVSVISRNVQQEILEIDIGVKSEERREIVTIRENKNALEKPKAFIINLVARSGVEPETFGL